MPNYGSLSSPIPVGFILSSSGAQVADKGNVTTEETFATVTIPANAMGASGVVRVSTTWAYTSSANNKTLRVKFGGTEFMTFVATTTTQAGSITTIQNRDATNSQVGGQAAANLIPTSATGAVVTASVDTTAAVTLLITGQKATGTETLTLERYLVELFPAS